MQRKSKYLWAALAASLCLIVALLVMLVTTIPILGAWWLTRDGENIAGSGK